MTNTEAHSNCDAFDVTKHTEDTDIVVAWGNEMHVIYDYWLWRCDSLLGLSAQTNPNKIPSTGT